MKHDFSIQEIVGALKKARGVQSFYTDAELAHLFDLGRDINDMLHYLPEPGPRLEHVDIPQISTDKVIDVDDLELRLDEVQLDFNAQFDQLFAWMQKLEDRIENARKPAPTIHPDPEKHPVILVKGTRSFNPLHWEQSVVSRAYVWDGGEYAAVHDDGGYLGASEITDWSPAKVVPAGDQHG